MSEAFMVAAGTATWLLAAAVMYATVERARTNKPGRGSTWWW